MNIGIIILGTLGFFVCLFVMYNTNHGIPGIQKFDHNFRLLDMRFRYNNEVIYDTFEKIGKGGIIAYRNYLLLDFCFITCFLIVMIAISFKLTSNNIFRYVLIGFAISRALLDIIENTILIILLHKYPIQNVLLANICSWATTIKFISLYLWILSIVVVLILKCFNIY